ncbi:MAG: hypothetical protein A2X35_01650 [Elusimicrobia bacterium GWA2_61_42]|nr:MAG: hypothetical protein A2X35_01650 [Elusimicrobia bacterium GWA2_61_42]OGR76851.1 MAG: hypothetical protein A2X38_11825 [Elusimicrobia bacterium GWC2_61_25]
MILFVLLITAAILAGFLYLFFIILFLIRRFGNRTAWSLAMHFVRPVLLEFYSYDLAEAANLALQAQPDSVHLQPLAGRPWKDAARVGELRGSLEELGFSGAGTYGVDVMPGAALMFMVNEGAGAAACIMEHPAAGVWLDIYSSLPGGRDVVVSSGKDPGLPARLRRPGVTMEYRAGADAAALYDRLIALRGPEKPLPLAAAGLAARFEEAWALDMDWRKQNEFLPEEALALKRGRALPVETVKKAKLFDQLGGGLAILNFAALVFFLIAAGKYPPVGDGPWQEALRYFLVPLGLFALSFAASIQAPGPVTRLVSGVFMAIIASPFFWGTFYMGGIWLNGARDTGQAVVRRAEVVARKATGRRDRDYYVVLKSWQPGRDTEKLLIFKEQYSKIVPGRTVAVVIVRPGRLGHEWIVRLDFETAPGSRDGPEGKGPGGL